MMRTTILAMLLGALLASPAGAQPLLGRGADELSVQVSPDFEGAIGDMLLAEVSWGRFLRDRVLARALASYAVLEDVAGEDSDYRMSELGLAAEYHFGRGGRVVPFAGLGLGWRRSHFGDLVESGLTYGPRAGVDVYLADNVALDFTVTYKLGSADVFVNDFVAEDTDFSSGIGLRVRFP